MFARSPTRTSPTSTAVGASQTSLPIVGASPLTSTIVALDPTARKTKVCRPYVKCHTSRKGTGRARHTHRGPRSPHRGRGPRAPEVGQAGRGAAPHVPALPAGPAPHPHRVRRHRAGERAVLPTRRP